MATSRKPRRVRLRHRIISSEGLVIVFHVTPPCAATLGITINACGQWALLSLFGA